MTRTFFTVASAVVTMLTAAALPISAVAQEHTVGVTVPNLASSFWISAVYGIEEEAKKDGVKVVLLNAGGDANSTQQISQIQDLSERKVEAMIVGATNGDAVKAVVERAIAAGIPVVGISSPPNTPKLASVVSADHYDMGKQQAQCLVKAIGAKGNVAMMAGPAGQAWSDQRAKGFKDTVKADAPAVKIVAESRLADNRNTALTTAEDWTQRFPDVTGIYAATDDMAAGIVSAYKSANKLQDVHISASNFSPTAQQLLKDGEIACTSIQQVVAQGRAAIQQAVAAATKQKVEKEVVVPALLVTRENMASVDLGSVVAPSDYRP